MFCFTVGVTLRIHSARFCLWEPPELKLISSDSGDTGLMLGRGSVKMASFEANHAFDSRSSHADSTLNRRSAAP